MRKLLVFIVCLIVLTKIPIATHAESIFEFSGEELSDTDIDGEYEKFLDSLPGETGDNLRNKDISEFDFKYFTDKIMESISENMGSLFKTASVLLGVVIIASLFNMYKRAVTAKFSKAYELCSTLCFAIILWEVEKDILTTVEIFLETLSNTMLAIVPTMEAISIYGGNITTAGVISIGVNLMIGLCTVLFSKVLFPGAALCYLLSVTAAITENKGVEFMSKALRMIIVSVTGGVAALSAFILSMQCGVSSSTDSLAGHTVRYAIGSYLPIVGGSVAESFSIITESFSVIKNMCGVGGIIVIILMLITPFAILLLNRLAIGISSSAAGILGSEREERMLAETGGTVSLLIGICASASGMFIIALGIFSRLPSAFGK